MAKIKLNTISDILSTIERMKIDENFQIIEREFNRLQEYANADVVENVNNRLKNIEDRLASAFENIATVEGQIRTHQIKITEHTKAIEKIGTDIDGINSEIKGLKSTLEDLENRATGVENRVDNAKEDIKDINLNITNIEAKTERLNVRLGGMGDKLADLEKRETELESKVTIAEGDVQTLKDDVGGLGVSIGDLTQANKRLAESTAEVKKDLDSMVGDVTTVKDDMANTKSAMETLEFRQEVAGKTISEINTKTVQMDEKVKALEPKVTGLDTDVKGLDTKVKELEPKVDNLGVKATEIDSKLNSGSYVTKTDLGNKSLDLDVKSIKVQGKEVGTGGNNDEWFLDEYTIGDLLIDTTYNGVEYYVFALAKGSLVHFNGLHEKLQSKYRSQIGSSYKVFNVEESVAITQGQKQIRGDLKSNIDVFKQSDLLAPITFFGYNNSDSYDTLSISPLENNVYIPSIDLISKYGYTEEGSFMSRKFNDSAYSSYTGEVSSVLPVQLIENGTLAKTYGIKSLGYKKYQDYNINRIALGIPKKLFDTVFIVMGSPSIAEGKVIVNYKEIK